MRMLEIVRAAAHRVDAGLAAFIERMHARREFTCGDCERWERCGLSPNDVCFIRLAQLERYDRRPRRRYLLPRW